VKKELIELRVNGRVHELAVYPNATLLETLREDLRLTGTKCACDDSSCGACTVLVEGRPMLACTMLAASYQESAIETIESLADGGELDALQRAFVEEGGAQCGFCTPGMVMSLQAMLRCVDAPSDRQIREAISGNICRCTGYMQIVRAVRRTLNALREPRHA
jgi:aerobic-type carbon monoxide dehydrogenase small subunit (CoxS/CutS family)